MSLEYHGWLDVVFSCNDARELEIPVLYLTDAIYEIAQKISLLGREVNEVIITVQTEPGEYRMRISKVSKLISVF